ncbi:RagB/SusD family nutrient uptake outer membrane protein [Daejeonella sp.]|uniref:RagB/SusD family nutrient uptake outer membrane protein n=1 Tax=Daejeonella sp. TaxID=2805397 RepID=UPI0030C53933
MRKLNKIVIALLIVTLFHGCSKDALVENSPSVVLPENLYVNKAGFDAGINGLYDQVRRSRSGNTLGSVGAMMTGPAYVGTDNAYANWRDGLEDIYNNWGIINNAAVDHFRLEWAWLYETINAANTITTRAENPNISWSATDKNLVLAEARAIRAWSYRHLTYMWGPVPLTLTESSGSTIKTDWVRAPVSEVQAAMEADWLFAEQHLPVTSTLNGKILKGVAQHYLAELYLAQGKDAQARDMALKVTTNNNYRLVTARYGVKATQPGTPFTDMFLDGNSNRAQGNTEALWVLQAELNVIGGEPNNVMRRYWVNRYYSFTQGGRNPFLVSAEYGGRGIGRYGPTKWALGIYPAGDDRGSDFAWRFNYAINNPAGIPAGLKLGDIIQLDRTSNEKTVNANWPHTRKWDYASPVDPNVDRAYNDQVYLRSADTYLLLAEAQMKTGAPGDAATTINVLRNRAKAPTVSAAQINLDFILDERSRELFSEEERRYTLLRTGKLLERVRLYNVLARTTIADRDLLFPIPQSVIDANLTLKMPNNPGY